MHNWPVQDAKARFSELINACINEGPQVVTRRGVGQVVLVPLAEWIRVSQSVRPSLKELLLTNVGRFDLKLPKRKAAKRRLVPVL